MRKTEQRGGGGGESLRGFYGSVWWRRRMRENESDGGDGGERSAESDLRGDVSFETQNRNHSSCTLQKRGFTH